MSTPRRDRESTTTMYGAMKSICRDADSTRSAKAGLFKGERVLTRPSSAHVGVAQAPMF